VGIWSARETEAQRAPGFDLEGKGGRGCGFGTEAEGLDLRLGLELRYFVPSRCWKVEVLLSFLESLRLVSPLTLYSNQN